MSEPNDHSEENNVRDIYELIRIPHEVLPPTYTRQFRAILEQEAHDEEDSLPPERIIHAIAPDAWDELMAMVDDIYSSGNNPPIIRFATPEVGRWDSNPTDRPPESQDSVAENLEIVAESDDGRNPEDSRRFPAAEVIERWREKDAIAKRLDRKLETCQKCKYHADGNRYLSCAVNPTFLKNSGELLCRDYEEEIIIEEDKPHEIPVIPPDAPDLTSFSNVGVSFSSAADALIRIWTAGRFS